MKKLLLNWIVLLNNNSSNTTGQTVFEWLDVHNLYDRAGFSKNASQILEGLGRGVGIRNLEVPKNSWFCHGEGGQSWSIRFSLCMSKKMVSINSFVSRYRTYLDSLCQLVERQFVLNFSWIVLNLYDLMLSDM